MKSFNLKRLAESAPASLYFLCNQCGEKASYKEANLGCKFCSSKLFRVSRYVPLIESPLTPYRKQQSYGTDKDNGDKLNQPGNMDEMGGSGFGGDYSPTEIHDGAAGEERGTPGGSSDSLLPEASPLRDSNNTFDRPTGAPNGGGSIPLDNLFDRIRNERKRR